MKTESIIFRASPHIAALLRENAAYQERSMTDLITSALESYLDANPGEHPDTPKNVLTEIISERERQIAKWGDGQALTPMEYLSIIGEEYGEVCRAVHDTYFAARYPQINAVPGDYSQYRTELIQLATVCVAAIQNLDKSQVL